MAKPELDVEIRPDGTVRLDLSGLPAEEQAALQQVVADALGGEVGQECAPRASAPSSLGEALRAALEDD